jgi:hypothetical protein
MMEHQTLTVDQWFSTYGMHTPGILEYILGDVKASYIIIQNETYEQLEP